MPVRTHAVDHADLADRAQVRVVDLGDAAVLEEQRIGECFLGRAYVLDGHARHRRRIHPFLCGELLHRLGQQRLVVHHHQQFFRAGAEAIRIVLRLEVGACVERFAGRGGQQEARVGHPVVDPAPVGALEVTLGRLGSQDPAVEHRHVDLLGALPHAAAAGHGALQQRGLDPLAAAGDLAGAQRGADRGGGGEEGTQAGPVGGRVQRAGTRGTLQPLVRDLDVGERVADACHVVDGPFRPATLLPLQPRARGDQRVVAGAVGVLVVAAVGGDRAVDQARVRLGERRVVDPQPLRRRRARSSPPGCPPARPAPGSSPCPPRPSGRARRCACRAATPCSRARCGTGLRRAARSW